MRLLIVEDDAELAQTLRDGLREHGIETTLAGSVPQGRQRAVLGHYDVIVLDVLLPGGDGFGLCQDLRRRGLTTPILMLTARDAVDDRVRGLNAGADDYLTKPFAFQEMVARVQALARRPPAIEPSRHRTADLEVDLAAHVVHRGERLLHLTAKEFALLECFVRHEGRVSDGESISSDVWDASHDPCPTGLEALVRRLRRKIDDPFEPKLIHTLRGAGYLFGVDEPARAQVKW